MSGCFMRCVTIWSIRAITSVVPSMFNRLPLSRPTYLLTADCDKPRRSAVCFSFKPCFSTMDLAIIAFTAGRTVFTPTSHGSIKFCTPTTLIFGGNYLNMSPVISYDACHDGQQQQNKVSPKRPLLDPSDTREKEKKINGQCSIINPKQRTQERLNWNAQVTRCRMQKLCTNLTTRMHNSLSSIQIKK